MIAISSGYTISLLRPSLPLVYNLPIVFVVLNMHEIFATELKVNISINASANGRWQDELTVLYNGCENALGMDKLCVFSF